MPVSTEASPNVDHANELRSERNEDGAPSFMKEFVLFDRGLTILAMVTDVSAVISFH